MSHSQSLDRLHLINEICNDFEDRILRGESASIEVTLSDVDAEMRAQLLSELLQVELYYLQEKDGQIPKIEAYVERFPNHRETIALAFDATQNKIASGTSGVDERQAPLRNVGDWIDRFKIEQILGTGAFGEVYLAYDEVANRPVAIKAMKQRPGENENLDLNLRIAQSFVEEADTLRRMNHPAIATVYEINDDEDGLPFVVLEYVKGDSLEFLLREGLIDLPKAVKLIADVAQAIAYVHQQDVFHRDLKPANIIVGLDGKPRIVDFGLAVQESQQRDRKGEVAGSIAYMSPEQLRGQTHQLDGRTDIWALGVMLYEILAGRRPFAGRSRRQLADEILNRAPRPIRQINDDVPVEMETICLRALEKETQQRYSTAQDFSDALRQPIAQLYEAHANRNSHHSETVQGRAAIKLASQASIWMDEPENQRLPTLLQYLRIRLLTRPRTWTETESALMDSSFRYYARWTAGLAALLLITFVVAYSFIQSNRIAIVDRSTEINESVERLGNATDPEGIAVAIQRMRDFAPAAVKQIIWKLESALEARDQETASNYLMALLQEQHLLPTLRELKESDRKQLEWILTDVVNETDPFVAGIEYLWPACQPKTAKVIIDHGGIVDSRFAFCSTLPSDRLLEISNQLAQAKYRLERACPYEFNDLSLVAAIWIRNPNAGTLDENSLQKMLPSLNPKIKTESLDIQDVHRPDFFSGNGGINGLADIRIRPVEISAQTIDTRQKYMKQLQLATTRYDEDDMNVRFLKARALFYLGNIETCLRELNEIAATDKSWLRRRYFLSLSAVANAKAGNEVNANQDFARLRQLYEDDGRPSTSSTNSYLALNEAKIKAFSGHHDQAEILLQPLMSDKKFGKNIARAYSVMAKHLSDVDVPTAKKYIARAIAILQDLPKNSERDLLLAHSDDLDYVRTKIDLNNFLSSKDVPSYSGIWDAPSRMQTEFTDGSHPFRKTPDQHKFAGKKLAQLGFLPVSIQAVHMDKDQQPHIASVWWKEDFQSNQLEQVKRIGLAAAALLKYETCFEGGIDSDSDLTALLRGSHDPSLQTQLIHEIVNMRLPVASIVSILEFTLDPEVQWALLLALAKYSDNGDSTKIVNAIEPTLRQLVSTTKDPGVYVAAVWLQQKLRPKQKLQAISKQTPSAESNWHVNSVGQTLVKLKTSSNKAVWIGSTEVTFEQMRLLDLSFQLPDDTEKPIGSVANGISWYQAAECCNKLSEFEEIPQDQWCYVPNRDGEYAEGMRIKKGFMKLTGYRLPVLNECMTASRAGSTSTWFHGENPDLLGNYAWFYPVRKANQVAAVMPNRAGLFDTLGNVFEWTTENRTGGIVDSDRFKLSGGSAWISQFGTTPTLSRTFPVSPLKKSSKQFGFRVVRSIQ